MIAEKNKKIIYWALYFLVFAFTVYFAFIFITNSIAQKQEFEIYKNSWQYVADTNFTQKVTIDPQTNKEIVCYEISSPEQLAGAFMETNSVSADSISSITNRTYRLLNDVDLSGKSWQMSSEFSGTFDGNSRHIKNLKISSSSSTIGFVQILTGTIKDVFFDNISVSMTTKNSNCNVGGVAGLVRNGNISNVYVTSGTIECASQSLSTNYGRLVGGLAGSMESGSIEKSINCATVLRGSHMGGIVGAANGGKIKNCINKGSIESLSSNVPYIRVGGIVGEMGSSASIELCQNVGGVSGRSTYSNPIHCANSSTGGIVGYANSKISKCSNIGNVYGGESSYTDSAHVGGIVGFTTSNVEDCYNTGNVSAYAKSTTTQAFKETNNNDATQIDTFRDAFVVAVLYNQWRMNWWYYAFLGKERSIISAQAYAGGIVGKRNSISNSVKNCYSIGSVSGAVIKYTDTYSYSYNYRQELWTVSPLYVASSYYESAARKYEVTLTYTYSYLYSPIIGNNGEGMGNISKTAGNSSFQSTNTYSYKLVTTDYFAKYLLLPINIATLIASLLTYSNQTATSTKSDNDYMYTDLKAKGDEQLFNVYDMTDMNCRIDASSSKISINSKYSLSSTVNDKREKTGSGNENIMSQSLNQVIPDGSTYSVTSNKSSILSIVNGNNAWKIDSSKNSGYPILKGLYW